MDGWIYVNCIMYTVFLWLTSISQFHFHFDVILRFTLKFSFTYERCCVTLENTPDRSPSL